jgi:hypothetical protein
MTARLENTSEKKGKTMRNILVKALGGIALAIFLAVMFTPAWGSGAGGGGRLEGAWDVQVTIRNCQTGARITSFSSVTTFMAGGTLVDSTSGTPPSRRTPGQCDWGHGSGDAYRFSFKTFNFDPAGTFTGWTKITHEAVFGASNDEYSSSGTSETYDTNGNLTATGCSTTTATRFQ